jgi:Undecaprenyl-phosphate galactose phosphotransferase WbaP
MVASPVRLPVSMAVNGDAPCGAPGLASFVVIDAESKGVLECLRFAERQDRERTSIRSVKLAVDVIVSMLLLVFLLPLFAFISLLICIDGGPVFYVQQRVGMNDKRFFCFKFRTMVPNSDAVLGRLLANDAGAAAEWAVSHKFRDDPRVTRLGAFLRKTSLDELPQLYNILRLEMSLVGPRPIVADEIDRYSRDIDHYYRVRPGLTGRWQVSGCSETTYGERVQLDVWYIQNGSFWTDLAILIRTIPAVVARTGARRVSRQSSPIAPQFPRFLALVLCPMKPFRQHTYRLRLGSRMVIF